MTDLIGWLGQRVVERWLTTIVLPGLAYTAVVGWAALAGHGHALDVPLVAERLDAHYRDLARSGPVTPVLSVVGGLAAATAAGLLAVAARDVLHRLLIVDAPQWWRYRLREHARKAWAVRQARPAERYLPTRATVVGERFRLIGERVDAQYGLSMPDVWPCLWLLIGADARAVVDQAHRRYRADLAIIAWALLYAPVALWWWPAGLVAVTGVIAGYRRVTGSSAALAGLIEGTVDAYQHTLASAVGVAIPQGRITPVEGNRINSIATRGARVDWLARIYGPGSLSR